MPVVKVASNARKRTALAISSDVPQRFIGITRLQYPLPTLQVVRYRTHMQGSLPAGG